ncbi:MAG: site-2 protease family protein [Rhodocyclaceae bacterium]|nr:site-2 protease family protein [Rhodocyclaceae bacterium]
MEDLIQTLSIHALPVLFAITLHEAAHGYVARYFGDPTAWLMGRISLNPLRHIDPIGTILTPALLLFASGGQMMFGWAKPVPVDFSRLRRPKSDMLWVAAAGPAANFLMALFWAMLLKLSLFMPENFFSLPLAEMARAGILVNGVLMLLNLLPIPPLDGGRIAVSVLPTWLAWRYARLEPWGLPILLVLLFLGALDQILRPLLGVFLLLVKHFFAL